jgi:hypothetical protein
VWVAALGQLGAAGGVGYDLAEDGYFHRELPYDRAVLAGMHPRLRDARALLDVGSVTVTPDGALVVSTGGEHRVTRAADGTSRCTCPWWGRHRGGRGPWTPEPWAKHSPPSAVTGRSCSGESSSRRGLRRARARMGYRPRGPPGLARLQCPPHPPAAGGSRGQCRAPRRPRCGPRPRRDIGRPPIKPAHRRSAAPGSCPHQLNMADTADLAAGEANTRFCRMERLIFAQRMSGGSEIHRESQSALMGYLPRPGRDRAPLTVCSRGTRPPSSRQQPRSPWPDAPGAAARVPRARRCRLVPPRCCCSHPLPRPRLRPGLGPRLRRGTGQCSPLPRCMTRDE